MSMCYIVCGPSGSTEFFILSHKRQDFRKRVFEHNMWGTEWCSWLRHYATIQKVAGSIPDGVTVIFH